VRALENPDQCQQSTSQILKSRIVSDFPGIDFPVLTIDATYNDRRTEVLLDVLEKYGARATFFLSGIWTELYSRHIPRMEALGCEIGNHSYDHPVFSELTTEKIAEQLEKTQKLNEVAASSARKYFRFPFGAFSGKEVMLVRKSGFSIYQWSIDSLDWKYNAPDAVFRIIQKTKPGDIVLMHNDGKGTAAALEMLLKSWKDAGRKWNFGNISDGIAGRKES